MTEWTQIPAPAFQIAHWVSDSLVRGGACRRLYVGDAVCLCGEVAFVKDDPNIHECVLAIFCDGGERTGFYGERWHSFRGCEFGPEVIDGTAES